MAPKTKPKGKKAKKPLSKTAKIWAKKRKHGPRRSRRLRGWAPDTAPASDLNKLTSTAALRREVLATLDPDWTLTNYIAWAWKCEAKHEVARRAGVSRALYEKTFGKEALVEARDELIESEVKKMLAKGKKQADRKWKPDLEHHGFWEHMDEVAKRVGFEGEEHMRRVFTPNPCTLIETAYLGGWKQGNKGQEAVRKFIFEQYLEHPLPRYEEENQARLDAGYRQDKYKVWGWGEEEE